MAVIGCGMLWHHWGRVEKKAHNQPQGNRSGAELFLLRVFELVMLWSDLLLNEWFFNDLLVR